MSSPPSSESSVQPAPDLSSKYSKLATEYSKLRAQSGVLKRAVLDEQAKNAELEENLRERETAIRKSEAEMDSLVFRNQQLARRVEVLQDEARNTKGRVKNRPLLQEGAAAAAAESLNSVMGEELEQKIAENARLHAALDGVDKRYEDRISALQSKVSQLEALASKKAQTERAEDTRLKDLVQGLKVNNSELTKQIKEMEQELVDKNDKITVLQVQLESAADAPPTHSGQQDSAAVASAESPASTPGSRGGGVAPHPATAAAHHAHLGGGGGSSAPPPPPLTSTDAHIQTVELLSQLGESVQDVVAGLSDLHTYWEHRIKDTHQGTNKPWTDSNTRLSKLLLQNVKHLKPIEQAYQDILSNLLSGKNPGLDSSHQVLKQFAQFSQNLSSYVKYAVEEVEPLTIVSIQQESSSSATSPNQQTLNGQLQAEIRAFNRVLERLGDHIEALTAAGSGGDVTGLDAVENITVAVSQLHQQAQEFYMTYKSKSDDENNLPTVSNQLQNTNKCIVAALATLVASLNNLSLNLSDNLPRIGALVTAKYEPSVEEPTTTIKDETAAAENINDVTGKDDDDVSCCGDDESAVEGLKETVANLQQEIESLNDRLKKAEQSKEHWKLEFQLVQMKYEKLKCSSLTENSAADEEKSDNTASEEKDAACLLFEERINQLVAEKMAADSKAAHFYLECTGLLKRIKSRERDKIRAEERLKKARLQIDSLNGDVQSTAKNYEGQLQMMSEHVANMNDKLAIQTDEIQTLQFQLKRKK